MTAMPGGGDYAPADLKPTGVWHVSNGPRQWFTAKTTGDKLDLVFQNVADDDGRVECVTHLGARDFVVFYSKQVER